MEGNYKNIIRLAAPIYGGMLSNNIVGIIDTAFLGRVNLEVQSAAGYGTLFYMVLFVVGLGFVLGPQILIARRVGEKRTRMAGLIFQHGLFYLMLYALFLFTGLLTFFKPLIAGITENESIGRLTGEYLHYRSFGIFFTMANLAFMSYYIGIGRSTVISVSAITAGVVNCILDYLLIFGHYGFPEMGIQGAAIASSIAEFAGTLAFVLYSLFFPKNKKYGIFRRPKITPRQTAEIFRLSLPLMLQNFVSMSSWFLFFTIIEKTGPESFGISIILRSIYSLFLISAFAMGSATNSLVSNYIGQGRQKEVFPLLGRLSLISFLFMLVTGTMLFLFKKPLFLLFTTDLSLADAADAPIAMIYMALILFSVSTILFNAVSGTGLIRITLLIETSCIMVYLLYTYIVSVPLDSNLTWIWSSEILYMLSMGLVSGIYLSTGRWKTAKI